MKTKLLFVAAVLVALNSTKATIRVVSNFPTGSAPYSDIQTAINVASVGDTIYINGSPTAYNSSGIDIKKRLVFIGTGYADSAEGNLNSIIGGTTTFDSNSGVSGSSGCQFMGISFQGFNNTGGIYPKDMFFSGCLFNSPLTVYNDGWVIQNCIFGANCTYGVQINYSPVVSCIFQGNFFTQGNCYGYEFGNNGTVLGSGLIIDHNFFQGDIGGGTLTYAIISNNIFFYAGAINSHLQNCQITNNLFYAGGKDSLPNGSGSTSNTVFNNYVAVSPNYQFNNTLTGTQSYPGLLSYSWSLLSSSLGHNKATDATDVGPTGGTYPINMNNSPIPPQMFQMNLSSLIPINDSLKVQFEARQQKQ